jgi:hypothetical protein
MPALKEEAVGLRPIAQQVCAAVSLVAACACPARVRHSTVAAAPHSLRFVPQVTDLDGQLRALRALDDKRMRLTREVATMQPKAAAADKLAVRLEQLEGEVVKNEELGVRLGELQAQADKLPGLRSRMSALQVRTPCVCVCVCVCVFGVSALGAGCAPVAGV